MLSYFQILIFILLLVTPEMPLTKQKQTPTPFSCRAITFALCGEHGWTVVVVVKQLGETASGVASQTINDCRRNSKQKFT